MRSDRQQTKSLTPFLAAVRRTILAIPRGKTMSYGLVAEVSGVPNGARAVVRALHSLDDIPWWRVCRAGGKFAHQTMPLQEELLRQEGWLPAERAKPKKRVVKTPFEKKRAAARGARKSVSKIAKKR